MKAVRLHKYHQISIIEERTIVVVDRNAEALELASKLGADHTVLADGKHVDTVLDMTGGDGAEVVLDFVAEQGAQQDAFAMAQRAGSHFVIGYDSNIDISTIDIIATERNIIGTYNDLVELMVRGQVHPRHQGRNVILEKITCSPDVINDGVTIARDRQGIAHRHRHRRGVTDAGGHRGHHRRLGQNPRTPPRQGLEVVSDRGPVSRGARVHDRKAADRSRRKT